MTAKKKPATKKTKKPAAEPASKKATVSKKTTATKPKPVSRAKSPKSTADKKAEKGKDGEMKVREIISKNSNKIASEPSSKKRKQGVLFRRCKKYFIKKEKESKKEQSKSESTSKVEKVSKAKKKRVPVKLKNLLPLQSMIF